MCQCLPPEDSLCDYQTSSCYENQAENENNGKNNADANADENEVPFPPEIDLINALVHFRIAQAIFKLS